MADETTTTLGNLEYINPAMRAELIALLCVFILLWAGVRVLVPISEPDNFPLVWTSFST